MLKPCPQSIIRVFIIPYHVDVLFPGHLANLPTIEVGHCLVEGKTVHAESSEDRNDVELLLHIVVYFFEGGEKSLIFVANFEQFVAVAVPEENVNG